jgi:hypothetical protein
VVTIRVDQELELSAPTNVDGWYEWFLGLNQVIRFTKLEVDGRVVPVEPENFQVPTVSRCFQHVNFWQQ